MEIAAIIFVIVMLGVAYIVFRLLKKAVKMAVRSVIVLLILLIAVAGGLALWSFGGKSAPGKTPSTQKSK
jgi:hypothetical protein